MELGVGQVDVPSNKPKESKWEKYVTYINAWKQVAEWLSTERAELY